MKMISYGPNNRIIYDLVFIEGICEQWGIR